MKQKASGGSVNISGCEVSINGDEMRLSNSVIGTVVINVTPDGVWINDEKCHLQSLVEELDEAYQEILQGSGPPLVDNAELGRHEDAMRRLRRVRRVLGLA